ncbi:MULTISPECIES: hypothetical protein [Pseudomonas]|uniref:Uncharacterized protein n=1 Tax=Pseudomonas bijieensis TaxID=2681983 RepID=A0A6N1CLK6_9PSED|nr:MULTISPECIES: hypothetical protein [Pseudomonas]QIB07462.1 hypothetical protein GZ982_22925 [Pseudomonas fluorescens]QKS85312.1 hypothetical protein GN234_26720 [Pseudomonas bijieensis]
MRIALPNTKRQIIDGHLSEFFHPSLFSHFFDSWRGALPCLNYRETEAMTGSAKRS